MKPGIIYGGVFLFTFVIVTGLLIYMNSSYENIFQFNFAPKSMVQLSDSTKTDSTKTDSLGVAENINDTLAIKDSVLLSSIGGVEGTDSLSHPNETEKSIIGNQDHKKTNEVADAKNNKTNLTGNTAQNNTSPAQNTPQGKEYTEWVTKVTSIYSAMEPRKAAKIIQTYSDNVARDILYNMNKKTAAKVVSELSPETANRIFRFE
jgi:hypothetical protein